jgi:hypothetical protein
MTRTLSALVTAISDVFVTKHKSSDADLLLWAKTEYGNDWRYAFQWMKDNPGAVPFKTPAVIKTAIKKDITNDEYFGV